MITSWHAAEYNPGRETAIGSGITIQKSDESFLLPRATFNAVMAKPENHPDRLMIQRAIANPYILIHNPALAC
jgi:hypothetical protein